MVFFIIVALILGQMKEDSLPGKKEGEHHIGEEVITGEGEIKINDQKFFFPPQIDPWSPVNELLAPESFIFDNALLKSVDSLTIPHHFIHSSFLRVPVERNFIYGDILVFLPSFEQRVAVWELAIANSVGETVRRVRQKGQPPAVITWDGRTDNGEPISTGDVYSFTFYAYDAQGNQTRVICDPQRINAILWKEKEEWVLSIAADMLFAPDGVQLAENADSRFDEIANVLKERFKKEIVVYIYAEKEGLLPERCRMVDAELTRRIILPKGTLKVAPRFIPGLQPKHSKVEIHIR